ncbi:M48 family metallopeptidase [Pseudodesulfovibrio sediminis]|uniref:Zinc protease n=1 Tax=Pseudodesulfovibrio sediminis TaxID=2810563 RepID=A0ABN6EWR1_9BACT|nr:YgjP-like metallopeptidase domain-containing protein [Pseudodesulfovibrio sediminis]BCS89278.1 zinc protease [Pseudodesulfovibrio sediminis]
MKTYAGLPLSIKTHPRAKRVLVKLIPGKGLEVVTPKGFGKHLVAGILDEKRPWIERTRDRLLADGMDLSGSIPDLPNILDFKAMDRIYQVDYLDRPVKVSVMENVARLQVKGPVEDRPAIFEALQRYTVKKAREIVLPMLIAMSRRTGLEYTALRVRRQKTRWGSCSARGTISVNAKLLFLPPELVNHLLLHELCHTRHLNHSQAYWDCVACYEPDYHRLEEELRCGGRFVPDWFA